MNSSSGSSRRLSQPRAVSLAATALATLGAAQGAHAQSAPSAAPAATTPATPPESQEIVITAERRASDVQRTAAAVSVERGQDLLKLGKFTLRDVLETIPGVSGGQSEGVSNEPTGNDSPETGVTIRGISSNGGLSGQTISGVPATAVYVDDVYGGIGGSYDIDRVEILRGPQGTLYGRSATAGLIAIHTRNPDLAEFGGDASAEGGSYDLLHLSGAVNVPFIKDELGLRVAGNMYQRNGVDIDRGVGKSRVTDLRGKLLFRPSSDFSLLVGGALEDRHLYNGGVVGNFVSPYKIDYSPYSVGLAKLKSREIWAEANWDFHGAKLTYVPAYRTWTQNADVFVVGPGGGSLKQIVTTPHDTFLTQELRLASEDSSLIRW